MDIQSDHFLEPSSSDLLRFPLDDGNKHDLSQHTRQNIDITNLDSPFTTKTSLTDNFIFDLLTLPDVPSPDIKEEPVTVTALPNHQTQQQFCMTWDPHTLNEALSNPYPLDLNSKQSGDTTVSCDAQGGQTLNTWTCNNRISDEDLSKPRGNEIRSRRRREFHKIHTRRSRAKLNEKMDLLKKVLPEPPSGVVVKSKAQIIDYAISVLGQLSFSHIRPDRACPSDR